MGISYSNAIHWHLEWVINILADIKTPEAMIPGEIARDDACEIGKWLIDEGAQYQDLPEYRELQAIHRDLHKCVADAVLLAQSGKLNDAEQQFFHDGACINKSKDLLEVCGRLFRKIDEGA